MHTHHRRSFLKLVDVEALRSNNPSYRATAKLVGDKYDCSNNMAEDRQASRADTAEGCRTLNEDLRTSLQTFDSFFIPGALNVIVFFFIFVHYV